jgi:hypothetical protein
MPHCAACPPQRRRRLARRAKPKFPAAAGQPHQRASRAPQTAAGALAAARGAYSGTPLLSEARPARRGTNVCFFYPFATFILLYVMLI